MSYNPHETISSLLTLKNKLIVHYNGYLKEEEDFKLLNDAYYWYYKGLAEATKRSIFAIDEEIKRIVTEENLSHCPLCKHFEGCEKYLHFAKIKDRCEEFEVKEDE